MAKVNFLLNCCVLVALVSCVIVQVDGQTFFQNGRYGKRSDVSRLRVASRAGEERFFGGPRFGRSGAATMMSTSNDADGRHPERFFIGSRYGKRSEMANPVTGLMPDDSIAAKELLDCTFTGIGQLYYCEKRGSERSVKSDDDESGN